MGLVVLEETIKIQMFANQFVETEKLFLLKTVTMEVMIQKAASQAVSQDVNQLGSVQEEMKQLEQQLSQNVETELKFEERLVTTMIIYQT